MSRHTRWFTFALAVAVFLALAGAAFAEEPVPDRAGRAEIRFLEGMIDHHQMALDMAMHCIDHASTDQVRALCEAVIAAQTPEIEQMQSWLRDWYGIDYQPMSMLGVQSTMSATAQPASEMSMCIMSESGGSNCSMMGGDMQGMGMQGMGMQGMGMMPDMMGTTGMGMGIGMMPGNPMSMMQMQLMMMQMQLMHMQMQMMGMDGMSGMGMMHSSGMPGMNGMQGMPGMSGMNGMQNMPGMSGMGSMNGMRGMSGMSDMQGMDSMGAAAGSAEMPGLADAVQALRNLMGTGDAAGEMPAQTDHSAHHPAAETTPEAMDHSAHQHDAAATPEVTPEAGTMPGMDMGAPALVSDPAMAMGMLAGFDRLTGLDYDLAWLEAMIEHHDGAVHMSERILQWAQHDELRTLANAIITAQSAEIEQMEALITELNGSR
ncbi:MAG: DUF305 domain-containing protein [Anaerolineae bacterium]